MPDLYLFNKPYGVVTQFRSSQLHDKTLADYLPIPDIYPAGRLDKDSEGLLLLTNDGKLQHKISHPAHKLAKTYWVQIEGLADDAAIKTLQNGVILKDGVTLPAAVERMQEPDIWPRDPPVRYRAKIPTSWLRITITQGKNRQVRRMTAAVGYPTLRLIRYAIGDWTLEGLELGQFKKIQV